MPFNREGTDFVRPFSKTEGHSIGQLIRYGPNQLGL